MWSERIAEYKTSGLTGKEWCELRGLKQHQLWYWVKKENEAGTGGKWLEVSMAELDPGLILKFAHVNIEVRQGFDPGLLLAVARALAPLC